jgi:hypothetical protein
MRTHLWSLVLCAVTISCKKQPETPQPPAPPPVTVLLKDMVVDRLPSPYYHFEYDSAKRVSFVTFASELTRYEVIYDGGRIREMRNNILVNKDRLQYVYGNSGNVELIKYADSTGSVYKTVDLFYDGPRLIRMERARRSGTGFVYEKTTTMTYYTDGNLKDITYHFLPFDGQIESTYTLHFEQYDDKINVDGFGLIHDEFFDHLFLLPGVPLQKNNPGKETLTGDSDNYTVNYTYTYNGKNAPLTKTGDLLILTGPLAGRHYHSAHILLSIVGSVLMATPCQRCSGSNLQQPPIGRRWVFTYLHFLN